MIECAKPDEYNDSIMHGVQSMCPMVAYGPMEKLELLAPPMALTLPIHYLGACPNHGHYLPTINVHVEGLKIQPT
jgi:hypothetical protein